MENKVLMIDDLCRIVMRQVRQRYMQSNHRIEYFNVARFTLECTAKEVLKDKFDPVLFTGWVNERE